MRIRIQLVRISNDITYLGFSIPCFPKRILPLRMKPSLNEVTNLGFPRAFSYRRRYFFCLTLRFLRYSWSCSLFSVVSLMNFRPAKVLPRNWTSSLLRVAYFNPV